MTIGASASSIPESYTLARVGTLRSAFSLPFGCPRQGLAAPSVRGKIQLEPWLAAAQKTSAGSFLNGLEGFSHVWIIFLFDRNRHSNTSFDPENSFLRPTVRPPWLTNSAGKRGNHGVFATRSPHRPNPIGLTVCKIDHIDHATSSVYISGVDIIDGTAVLDIKPYHPIDALPSRGRLESREHPNPVADESEGKLSTHIAAEAPCKEQPGVPTEALRFPSWLPAPKPLVDVRWWEEALEGLRELQHHCEFYPDARDVSGDASGASTLLQRSIEELLGLDPRTPQSRSRGAGHDETRHRYWALDFDAITVVFRCIPDPLVFEVVRVARKDAAQKCSKAWLSDIRATIEGAASDTTSASCKRSAC